MMIGNDSGAVESKKHTHKNPDIVVAVLPQIDGVNNG